MSLPAGNPAALCAILVALTCGATAFCQEMPDPVVDGLHARALKFLEKVSQGQVETAYQDLLRDSPLMRQFEQSETLKELVEKTGGLLARYGECRKIERVAAKRVGENLVVLRYLFQCESFPLVWHFVFYRTPARDNLPAPVDLPWRLVVVRFDMELEKLAE
ncbi:MAG: hypothetical protein GXY83_28365 [Rhodopirellula sp.]|nr:hypothetical protein [Rhodopirellula sp.]